MKSSEMNSIFKLKKMISDIRNYNKDWRYTNDFEKIILDLNDCSRELRLPDFHFENFHFSNSRKTINETGFKSLLTHISILEEMMSFPLSSENKNISEKDNSLEKSKKIFIVHGRDKAALLETEGILHRVGLEPIVLNRMTNSGLTLIEKFEKYSDVGFAIVLLTPDDVGALFEEVPIASLNYKFRARQNVLFELGFFYGKLGRSNVCCILKSNVEKPSDIDGIAYLPYNQSVDEIEYAILRELKSAEIDFIGL